MEITYSALTRSTQKVLAYELCPYSDGAVFVIAVAFHDWLAGPDDELVFVDEIRKADHPS